MLPPRSGLRALDMMRGGHATLGALLLSPAPLPDRANMAFELSTCRMIALSWAKRMTGQ